MFIAAYCLFKEEILLEASVKAILGAWIFDVLFSVKIVTP
jgi:hypothetical protein